MKSTHLAAKYRPQTFADVAGQEAVKAVLSRAALENRIAPAYLFSGTRGVGKTTLARILAKAVNCEAAPTAEPCNVCRHCRAITAGAAVDVMEIDAASNRGIDDIRRLKEDIGYAPLECRYKVFIVDEAHQLSKDAFNALLKTLEEPPPHATFILASTEPHKFPATIISRCQHFTFKRLPQAQLEAHLRKVLEREGQPFEDAAVSLIARRGAGSVRDSMSLLAQSLALGGEALTAAGVREVLGLAGQEVYLALMDAFLAGDCLAVSAVLRQVLDQGLDLGFFLRELAAGFRSMFLLRQAGESALPALDLPEAEARQWLDYAQRFDIGRIHASWQLTLEGQRRVLKALEPALALELLLFNLATLPQLLPLERAAAMAAPGQSQPQPQTQSQAPRQPPARAAHPQSTQPAPRAQPVGAAIPRAAPQASAPAAGRQASQPGGAPAAAPEGPRTWEGFLAYMEQRSSAGGPKGPGAASLRGIAGALDNDALVLTCLSETQCGMLTRDKGFPGLTAYAAEYFGPEASVRVASGAKPYKSNKQVKEQLRGNPALQTVMEHFGLKDFDVVKKTEG